MKTSKEYIQILPITILGLCLISVILSITGVLAFHYWLWPLIKPTPVQPIEENIRIPEPEKELLVQYVQEEDMVEFVGDSGQIVLLPAYFRTHPYVIDFLNYFSGTIEMSSWYYCSINKTNPKGYVSLYVANRVQKYINANMKHEDRWAATLLVSIL